MNIKKIKKGKMEKGYEEIKNEEIQKDYLSKAGGTKLNSLRKMYMDLKMNRKSPEDVGLGEYSKNKAMAIIKEEIEEYMF